MKFRFEPILKLHKNVENLRQKELGTINTHLQKQQGSLRFMERVVDQSQDELNTKKHDQLNINTLHLYYNFFTGVRLQSQRHEKIVSEIQEKVDAKRAEVVQARRKRRTMELLKERETMRFNKAQEKKEVALLDEVASNLWQAHS